MVDVLAEINTLAALPQRTPQGWHGFVASGDERATAAFGRTYRVSLALGAIAAPGGDEAGEMIEFEVMIRSAKALQALGEEMGNRLGPHLIRLKQAAAEA